jgi:SAM-dependent methyltransferase
MNPPTGQYADELNLKARQGLWAHQQPTFDLFAWVISLLGPAEGHRILDIGCGNGAYLPRLAGGGWRAIGCDASPGILRSARGAPVTAGKAERLPFYDGAFDAVLAAHMLYHVEDQPQGVRELKRVLTPGGSCIAVTNGSAHVSSIRRLVEAAVQDDVPGWRMLDEATLSFSLDNGTDVLRSEFDEVLLVRPNAAGSVVVTDATVVSAYVASLASVYQQQVSRPWPEVVANVGSEVQQVIDREGAFVTSSDTGAFVCR